MHQAENTLPHLLPQKVHVLVPSPLPPCEKPMAELEQFAYGNIALQFA